MAYKVFVIAGEHSGDVLGASFIRDLKDVYPDVEIRGIGGEKMLAAGLKESFFPMDELSVMGIAEILPRIPKFIGLIRKTVQEIKGFNPDVVLTIDSPDFSFRVQRAVKKERLKTRQFHYVAPTVWAWRPERARKIAQFLDGIICLFPFEIPYFETEGLKAVSVTHPMVTSGVLEADGERFRAAHHLSGDDPVLGLFCGSRRRELEMSLPIMRELVQDLRLWFPDLKLVVPTLPKWQAELEKELGPLGGVIVTSDPQEKYDAFKACDAAAVVSGTVALEVALAGVPHVLFYRMNGLTWEIVRRMVKTRFAHLGNILLDRAAYPEFIQDKLFVVDIQDRIEDFLKHKEESRRKFSGLGREVLGYMQSGAGSGHFPLDFIFK